MLVDPIQTAVNRWTLRQGIPTLRVQRGCGFFTGGRWSRTGNTRREGSEGCDGLDDRGLRLSLTLPCSTSRGVIE